MKKYFTLIILSSILSINHVGAEDSDRAPKAHPQTEDSSNLSVYLSFLYWQLGSYNTFYQTTCEPAQTAIDQSSLYPESSTNFIRSDAKTKPGFNIGCEWLLCDFNCWSVGLQYQWIKHNITTIEDCCDPSDPCNPCHDDDCGKGWSWWGASTWLGQAQFALINSRITDEHSFTIDEVHLARNKTLWQSVDFTLAKSLNSKSGKRVMVEPKMGIEFNWFKMESFFNGRLLEMIRGADAEHDYFQWCHINKPWAIGPFAGANLALRFDQKPSVFSIFGNFKVAENYTKHKFNQSYREQTEEPCGGNCEACCNTSCCDPTDRFSTTMLHTNVKLGMGYTHTAKNIHNMTMGFDASVAWELNTFVDFFDAIHAWMWSGDLNYQGLTFSVSTYF